MSSNNSYGEWPEASVQALCVAVAKVNRKFAENNDEPGAERWVSDSRKYTPMLVNAVIEQWRADTGGMVVFPWHDDFVVRCWVAFRKMPSEQKAAYCLTHNIHFTSKQREDKEYTMFRDEM